MRTLCWNEVCRNPMNLRTLYLFLVERSCDKTLKNTFLMKNKKNLYMSEESGTFAKRAKRCVYERNVINKKRETTEKEPKVRNFE